MGRWWAQKIHIRHLRAKAREMRQSSDLDRGEMGEVMLEALRGRKPGRYNFVEVAWNRDNLTQRAFSVAGEELLDEGY